MTGRASAREDDACDFLGVEDGRLCGQQIVDDEDAGAIDGRIGDACQLAEYLLSDRVHVDGAFAQVGVVDGAPFVFDGRHCLRPRARRGHTGLDAFEGCGHEVGIVEHHQVGVEDGGVGGAVLRRRGAQALDVGAYSVEGVAQSRGLGVGGVELLVRGLDVDDRGREHRTDRDPGRRRQGGVVSTSSTSGGGSSTSGGGSSIGGGVVSTSSTIGGSSTSGGGGSTSIGGSSTCIGGSSTSGG